MAEPVDAPVSPDIQLPSAPGQPVRMTVRPAPKTTPQTDLSQFGIHDAPPAAAQPSDDLTALGIHDTPPAATEQPPMRQIGTGEAALLGARHGASFGTAPAIAGLSEASGETGQKAQDYMLGSGNPGMMLGGALAKPVIGGAKLLAEHFSAHPDGSVRDAYDRGREFALNNEKLAQDQHAWAYLSGMIGGAVTTGIGGAGVGGGATALGRIGRAVQAGAGGGGLFGAGEKLSEGGTPAEIGTEALKGAGTGAVFGGAGGAGAEVGGAVAGKVASLFRGARDPDTEAGRAIVQSLRTDWDRAGPSMTPGQVAVANQAGVPRAIVDTGGESTRALARSAANTSPEARTALNEVIEPRFHEQGSRIGGYVRRLAGGGNATDDLEAIRAAARAANRPAYQRAYAAGDRPIWSPELERLSSAPSVQRALSHAQSKWKDWQVHDGFGAANPPVRVNVAQGGILQFTGGRGMQVYPNIQFWDYAARHIADRAESARRAGNMQEAARLGGIERQLKAELDRLVPEFQTARRGAAGFFGAEDALEAGQNFVMSNANLQEAARNLARMTAPERDLFARGFASDLADNIEKIGFNRDVLKSIFVNNGPARQKIYMALGPQRAQQLEALLHVERAVDEIRKAMGNSTTARQLHELGMAAGHGVGGAGAVGLFELIKEHDFNPAHLLAAALTVGAAKRGAQVIDAKIARRVGEMLASDDPRVLARGLQIVTKNPTMFNALRNFTVAGSVVGAHQIGPANAAAGAAALAQRAVEGPPDRERHNEKQDAFSDMVNQQ